MLGRARLASGESGAALECFEEAAQLFEPSDPRRSVDALIRCAILARFLVGPRATLKFAERARGLSEGAGTATLLHVEASRGAAYVTLGVKEGFEILSRTAGVIESDPSLLEQFSDSGWWPLVWCSGAAGWREQFDKAQKLFDLGFSIAERKGWPTAMGAHLVNHVDLMTRLGHLEDADRDVDELERLAAQIPVLNMFSISMRTGLQLDMGLWTDAEKGCVVLEAILDMFEEPPPSLFLWVMRIRGELELASGRIENACTAFERAERVAVAAGVMEPNVAFWWVPSIDAYRDSGRFGDLERIVCWLEEMTADSTNRWPTAAAMAGRAMLSEEAGCDATAGALFDEATTCMGAVPMPLERARLLTWQGAFLRRQGDLRSARRTLIKAFQLADSRGAGLVANQARSRARELRVDGSGGRHQRSED